MNTPTRREVYVSFATLRLQCQPVCLLRLFNGFPSNVGIARTCSRGRPAQFFSMLSCSNEYSFKKCCTSPYTSSVERFLESC
jgi:hypothetical protein